MINKHLFISHGMGEAQGGSGHKGINLNQTAKRLGITRGCLRWRIEQGWPAERWGEAAREPIDYRTYVGKTFTSVIVRELTPCGASKSGNLRFLADCECLKCGHKFKAFLSSLQNKKIKNHCPECAKVARRTARREYKKERVAWNGMMFRCYNPKSGNYKNYGGRGITVCDRWRESFDNFLKDMGKCPDGYSIDRIDVNGNYEPSNCRWADAYTQSNNRTITRRFTYNGITLTSSQWAMILGVQPQTIRVNAKRNGGVAHIIDEYIKKRPELASVISDLQ